jgi:superfamily II DNA or RNA helicase
VQVNIADAEDDGLLEGVVLKVSQPSPQALRQLTVQVDGTERKIEESAVAPAPPDPDDAVEILESLNWRAPFRFFARWNMRKRLARWYEDSDGIPALLGSRVKPMGHQIYAARRVLWDRSPRFILADEVGLGKTIEAGLVLQGLLAANPELTVLVIAPGSMTRQWLSELYLRFGARAFTHMDSARWRTVTAKERQALLQSDRLIVSTTVLLSNAEAQAALLERAWGLVIVDEAHQFEPGDGFFPFLEALSHRAEGFLALSATPSKREVKGMLGLLSLVAPDVYRPTDLAGLEKRLAVKQVVWDRLAFTTSMQMEASHEGMMLDPEALQMVVDEWQGVVDDDPVVAELLGRLKLGQADALDELVAYIQEFYRIDHRLIRTRRATLSALGTRFSQRQMETIEYEPSATESILSAHLDKLAELTGLSEEQWELCGLYHRAFSYTPQRFQQLLAERSAAVAAGPTGQAESLVAAYRSDPGPQEEAIIISELLACVPSFEGEGLWLDQAQNLAKDWVRESSRGCERLMAAVRWVKQHLAAMPDAKIIIFSQDRVVAEAMAQTLEKSFGAAYVATFHHGLPEERLAEVATRFQRQPSCHVLVSDELGGEGRNFQMASAVLHLDTPWSLARLEQRIGRLDRIGREPEHPVISVVMRGPGSVEQEVQALHHEVFQVFTRSVGGLEFALPRLQRQLHDAACAGREALVAARVEMAKEVQAAIKQSDEEFDLALDSARPEIKRASDLAEVIEQAGFDGTLTDVRAWGRVIGVEGSPSDNADMEFKWSNANLTQSLPGIGVAGPGPHRFHGTFNRHRALAMENLQYFAPGHRLIDALVASLHRGPEGRATVFMRELGPQYQGRLYMLLLGYCSIQPGEASIPAGLLTRAHRRLWPQVACSSLVLLPGQDEAARLVEDPTLKRLLEAGYQGKAAEPKIEPEMLLDAIPQIQYLWQAVNAAVPLGLAAIREARRPLVEAAVRDLAEDLRHEMGFFRGRIARGGRTPEVAQAREELKLRETLLERVGSEAVELDAIALVFGT